MSNARNNVTIIGNIPNLEKLSHAWVYKEGDGDKKSFARGLLSVRRSFKPKGEQYYPNDLIPFRVFGFTADYLERNMAKDGSTVLAIAGNIQISDNYTKDDGSVVYGQPFVMVDDVTILEGYAGDGAAAPSSSSSSSSSGKKAPFLNLGKKK